jgi:hypothetical protein
VNLHRKWLKYLFGPGYKKLSQENRCTFCGETKPIVKYRTAVDFNTYVILVCKDCWPNAKYPEAWKDWPPL